MSNVLAYVRVSSRNQLDGDGPDRQRQSIYDFCAKHRLVLLEEFEEAVTGIAGVESRPVFLSMLKKIEEYARNGRPITGIVIERLDRLARELVMGEVLMRDLKKRDIKLYCADRGELEDVANDSGDPTRVLIRQVIGALAQWEKSQIVLKLRGSRLRVRQQKGVCEGQKPYGELPGEKKVLDFACSLFELKMNNLDVANELNRTGFRTRHGRKWTQRKVSSLRHGRFFKNRVPSPGSSKPLFGGNSSGGKGGLLCGRAKI